MADGLCTGDTVSNVIEKTYGKEFDRVIECMDIERVKDVDCANVKSFYISSDSDKLFDKLCSVKGPNVEKHEGFLVMEMPCSPSPGEEDCRKKRCADRYDSSESSDSGVAVLSCTDCSGSSTASSDITDPGSPFSTASSHSEDSASQPAKMPPTQSAHHPPWPWATGASPPPLKRHTPDKTAFPKRIKTDEDNASKQRTTVQTSPEELQTNRKPPASMSSTLKSATDSSVVDKAINTNNSQKESSSTATSTKKKLTKKADIVIAAKAQGKITEYFKAQMKANGINKKDAANPPPATKSNLGKNPNLHKYFSLVDGLKQNVNAKTQNNLRKIDLRTANPALRKVASVSKNRKLSPVTVPRKILPAPSKVCDKVTVSSINNVNNISNFAPTVTLTTLAIPPNLTYLHTKTPKPPDNFIVQQFATLGADKINAIPIVGTPCINTVLHPLQKITTINNFNCIKLNATVVPIVKLNTLPSKLNGSNFGSVTLNVEAGVPTVLPAKPKISESSLQPPPSLIKLTNFTPTPSSPSDADAESKARIEEQSPSSSDSGVSAKSQLEISVSHVSPSIEPQKSPILSQPKTIRFPAKQESVECKEVRSSHSNDCSSCRWADCQSQFDTSGALLEHLQIKHVISQATQEQYVCLWLGCKVHGRTSCSRTWLERHVLAHAGTKPFRCIVEGCGMRFNSQLSLERHVNGHFSTDSSQNGSAKKSVESGSVKLYKRNGKRYVFVDNHGQRFFAARMFDFFDNGIMEGLQHQLLNMTQARTTSDKDDDPGDTVLLHSRILAKRIESDGKKKVLLRWHPVDIIPDEWIEEGDYCTSKTVSIRTLQPTAINTLKPLLFPMHSSEIRRQKQRRKPSKCT